MLDKLSPKQTGVRRDKITTLYQAHRRMGLIEKTI